MTQNVTEPGLPTPKDRRRLREAADLTHEQIAEAVGVTATTVRSWESGRTDPRGRKREAYAELLSRLATTPPPAPAPPDPPDMATAPSAAEALTPAAGAPEAARAPSAAEAAAPVPAGPEPAPAPSAAEAAAPAAGGLEAAPAPSGPEALASAARGPEAAPAPSAAEPLASPTGGPEAAPAPSAAGSAPTPGSRVTAATPRAGEPAAPAPSPAISGDPEAAPAPGGPGAAAAFDGSAVAPAPAGPEGTPASGAAAAGATGTAGPAYSVQPSALTAHQTPPAAGSGTCGGAPAPQPEQPTAEAEPQPTAEASAATAFDLLYARTAGALARQAYLLTGRRALALESVERAFHRAWQHWPEVATDPDPVGWVRLVTYEHALSPWHHLRRTHRHPDRPPADPADRILLDAMLALPPAHRRTVLLYDGVGLDLPDTAAETEATTPTAGGRLVHAHEELAELLPELAAVAPEKQSALLRARLGSLRPAVPLQPRPAAEVRTAGEHRIRVWTRAALGLTAVIAAATAYTAATAPTSFVPPESPGASVSGVPPLSGPQQLTDAGRHLHDKLRGDPSAGTARIHPKGE
ncbi:helix-turn-helix domain-containing protein [Streptomyces sp. NPDC060028]|uniref:helix-turn-helix domain-containing protein n=1 Tax=Streptomyces sp. NPDC060028 TaxID=3347041 RepID=UPI003690D709